MSQALDASSYTYQGVWVDWNKGKTTGATLTLAPSNATILVAVLAIFVQVAGSQLWKVFQLALHQCRATQKPRDAIHHQQQAILRNNHSDFSSIWQLLQVGLAWRHQRTVKPLRRSFSLILWALLHFMLFALAGIFSTPLVNTGHTVLSRSPFCGRFNTTYLSSLGSHTGTGMPDHLDIEYYAHSQTRYQQSQEYANSCYTHSETLAKCNQLARPQLSWNVTTNASCPFDSSVCLTSIPRVTYDTGFISSHQDLGLNAPQLDRVWYRKNTTCTVLNDARFVSGWKNIPATADSPAKSAVDAYYGPDPLADRNATYSYSEGDQYYSYDQYSTINPYQVNARYAAAGDTHDITSNFIPIPELARADADITLVFLSFSQMYEAAVYDPWFSATKTGLYPARNNKVNATVFRRDRPLTTVGCTEQHQICTAGNSSSSSSPGHCTPMLGWLQLAYDANGVETLNFTSHQYTTYRRVFQAAIESIFPYVLQNLAQRDPPLLARRQIQGIVGLGLPDNQWQLETEYWHSIAMAHLQRAVVAYGTGEFAANTAYINVSTEPSDQWLCRNLIINGSSYQSFSLFALTFIFVIGLLVVVAGATIEELVAWLQRKLGRGISRQKEWTANGLLEMQSWLYEHVSCGVWSHSRGIPICGPGETMGVPKRRQRHQHNESSDTSGSSFDVPRREETRFAARSLRAGLTSHGVVEYEMLEDADGPDRTSYPPLGWGVLPPPGTAL
jgi:hypothetical protein